jgi:TolA-binding protein
MSMTRTSRLVLKTAVIFNLVSCSAAVFSAPPQAEHSDVKGRVDRLEREMKAVQRKIFPGPDPRYFPRDLQPEIVAQPLNRSPQGFPVMRPVAELGARAASVEKSLSHLTASVEQNSFRLRQLAASFKKTSASADNRLDRLEEKAPSLASETQPPADSVVRGSDEAASSPPEKPDPGERAYLTGYHLWSDKRYREAIIQLNTFIVEHPNDDLLSQAHYILGRAYIDSGKFAKAVKVFYYNYKKRPHGKRAPDSLYYLGLALTRLKRLTQACKSYDELADVYGKTMSPTLQKNLAEARASANCWPLKGSH